MAVTQESPVSGAILSRPAWGTPFLHELLSHIFAFCKAASCQRLMCLGDVWQWLSGTFEAHPISRFRFSFLVIYGTFDEFSLSADMFHNCQSFDWNGISEKKMWNRKKKVLSPHYFFLCPKLPGLRFTAPSFSYSVTCWPCRLASSLSFYSLVPGLLGLLFCLFGPFLVQMVNATESSSLEKVSELSH